MTTQWLYLTWFPMYLCNQTHLIDDITLYVHMKSQPLHVWHHRHFIWHHIHSWRQHTIVCMSWNALCLWHHVYYIWCHPLYLTWNPLKLPSHILYMSSHPLCRRHQTYWVRRHRWHMYAIICVIHDIISTLYDISPYYLWDQMHYIHYITCTIYDISSTLYDVTFTMCVTSHNDSVTSNPICLWHIHLIWHNRQCYDHTTIVCLHSHYAWDNTQCIFDFTHNVPTLWKEVNICHHSLYMYDTISTTYDITSTLYGISTLYVWCQVHHI